MTQERERVEATPYGRTVDLRTGRDRRGKSDESMTDLRLLSKATKGRNWIRRDDGGQSTRPAAVRPGGVASSRFAVAHTSSNVLNVAAAGERVRCV